MLKITWLTSYVSTHNNTTTTDVHVLCNVAFSVDSYVVVVPSIKFLHAVVSLNFHSVSV